MVKETGGQGLNYQGKLCVLVYSCAERLGSFGLTLGKAIFFMATLIIRYMERVIYPTEIVFRFIKMLRLLTQPLPDRLCRGKPLKNLVVMGQRIFIVYTTY